jgi:hypothetical protein
MSLISLTDYRPMPRYDRVSWAAARIDGATSDAGPWEQITSVPFDTPDADPAKPGERNFTISLTDPDTKWLRVVFVDEHGEQDVTKPVPTTAETISLATIRDVALRLGRYLTENEEVQVSSLIIAATSNIYAAVDKLPTWVPPAAVHGFLSGLCIELVTRAMPNPHGLASQSETLGAHSVTQAYSRDIPGSGVTLTAAEELAARRVVHGRTSASSKARGLPDELADDGSLIVSGDDSMVLLAGVDAEGPFINTDVISDDAGGDGTGVWIDSNSDSALVGVDGTGPWIGE